MKLKSEIKYHSVLVNNDFNITVQCVKKIADIQYMEHHSFILIY